MQVYDIIYLQYDPNGDGETTWCQDLINDDDVQYVHVGLYNAVMEENERLKQEIRQWRRSYFSRETE